PVRFILYGLVGLSGLFLHLLVLGLAYRGFGLDFFLSQSLATLLAMISNFFFNNIFTFRNQRLKGSAFLIGAFLYMLICSVGAIANIQVADYLFSLKVPWWVSGAVGALVGAVWNYAVSTQIVWTWFRDKFVSSKKRISLS
ncbi:MAG: GtrA family protein, partial [Chthoniobacterales bacterium]|nr:GtrA family protein [Chthoniobacterales bacterium]